MHHFVACTSSISWDIILFSHIQYKTANITCFVWEVLPKSFESWPSHGNACAHLSQLESSPRLWTYNMGRTKEVRGPVQHVYRWHWHLVASSKAHWWCGSLPILSWRPVVTLNGISSLSCWDAPPPRGSQSVRSERTVEIYRPVWGSGPPKHSHYSLGKMNSRSANSISQFYKPI